MNGDRIRCTIACGTADPEHNGCGLHTHNNNGLWGNCANKGPATLHEEGHYTTCNTRYII